MIRRYLLREYGSWGVMMLAFLAGIAAARSFSPAALGVLAGLSLSINAKQAFTEGMRSRGAGARTAFAVFSCQAAAAALLFWLSLGSLFFPLLPYAAVPLAYVLLLRFRGEHALVTEAAGFVLLSLSALVANAGVTCRVDPRLFLAVAVFFTAGVFKVRIQFRKKRKDRLAMAGYLAGSAAAYLLAGLPLICLAPLADNLVFAARPYQVKLQTTGWLEVAKGMLFVLLVAVFYR